MTETEKQEFFKDAYSGLSGSPKKMNPKYFYDRRGSQLFEEICQTDEYYLTRTELDIFQKNLSRIIGNLAGITCLAELGSGASVKTRLLLTNLPRVGFYIPVDVSRDFLHEAARGLRHEYQKIKIAPLIADFTTVTRFNWPDGSRPEERLVFFPGSTIGNFEPHEAAALMARWARIIGPGGYFLIGVDLVKDAEVLESAYNDSRGVTRDFNLNIISRLKSDLGLDLSSENFRHKAFFNEEKKRVEMHLVSKINFHVEMGKEKISFRRDETIHTENSYKFHLEEFERMAMSARLKSVGCWTDSRKYFGILLLKSF